MEGACPIYIYIYIPRAQGKGRVKVSYRFANDCMAQGTSRCCRKS